MTIQKITALAGLALVQGFADEVITLHEVLAFDLRFNLRHPKIAAIYMLETPINGCHFEVVKRDGNRYHVGGDIAGKLLGEEKAYMGTLEQMATQAREQSGLIRQFCRKSNLFDQLFPKEAREQEMKDKQKELEEGYLNKAGDVMSRLAKADKALPPEPVVSPFPKSSVSAAVSKRVHAKLRANCEIQYALAHSHLPKWLSFLASKSGQVLSKTESWRDSDPTGSLLFEARGGEILLSRDGKQIGAWDTYAAAHSFMQIGTNTLPNPVLPLTKVSYDRTVGSIPADATTLRKTIRAQVTPSVCDPELWEFLNP